MRRLLNALAVLLIATAATGCADAPTVDVDADTSEALTWADTASRPSFALWKSSDAQFRFRLVDAKGALLLTSEGYASRTAALTGLLSVLANGGTAARYEVKATTDGRAYVTLKAVNGEVIGTSGIQATTAAAQATLTASVGAVGTYRTAWATATGRRFAVHLDAGGKYYWNLHAGNGAIVLRSERYDTEAAALNGAFAVLDNGAALARYQVLPSSNGGAYLNLTATNGQVIGTSEVYASKANAERARDALIALVPTVVLL